MNKQKKEQGRLGWLAAGMPLLLCALLSSANAMGSALTADPIRNFDHVIEQNESDSAQILQTLGRGKTVNSATSEDTDNKVNVQLYPAKKERKFSRTAMKAKSPSRAKTALRAKDALRLKAALRAKAAAARAKGKRV